MLIYEALEKDHLVVKKLLARLIAVKHENAGERHEIIRSLRNELIPHARAEETVFYNSLRPLVTTKLLVSDAYQEHLQAETLLRLLQVQDQIDAKWKQTARKLKAAIEHHIKEEEGKIFKAAKQVFTTQEAQMMAEAFKKLKPIVRRENLINTTLDLFINMLPPVIASRFQKNNLESRLR